MQMPTGRVVRAVDEKPAMSRLLRHASEENF